MGDGVTERFQVLVGSPQIGRTLCHPGLQAGVERADRGLGLRPVPATAGLAATPRGTELCSARPRRPGPSGGGGSRRRTPSPPKRPQAPSSRNRRRACRQTVPGRHGCRSTRSRSGRPAPTNPRVLGRGHQPGTGSGSGQDHAALVGDGERYRLPLLEAGDELLDGGELITERQISSMTGADPPAPQAPRMSVLVPHLSCDGVAAQRNCRIREDRQRQQRKQREQCHDPSR